MKTVTPNQVKKPRNTQSTARVELGRYIVADPLVCHGKPTFKGTRIMVWQLFEHLTLGEAPEDFPNHFPGQIPPEAVQEALELF